MTDKHFGWQKFSATSISTNDEHDYGNYEKVADGALHALWLQQQKSFLDIQRDPWTTARILGRRRLR